MIAVKSISTLVHQEIPLLVSKFAPPLEDFHCKQIRFVRNCICFVFTSLTNFTKTAK